MSQGAEQIFHVARKMSPEMRDGYLKGACGDDLALRNKVEALLKADEEAGAFLETIEPIEADPDATITQSGDSPDRVRHAPNAEQPGQIIGHYKLLQIIGEGGFGSVWMAEQKEPVNRRVALKIIKLGMDTKQVIARFEQERQALAMMDHPNIAKVLDAGSTESGRPYFAMELVRGESITDYCDRHNLSVQDRLRLFQKTCNAVQHAHQKGIIHRDIKPSNVMITLHDGRPVPMVIDFGIAKATNSQLTEKTIFTEFRQLVGTPEYMSPEQAEMSGLDIDTRSDVYSLGVLLYELLTGTTPFDSKKLRSAAFGEIQRIIREETPHKPSTRLSTLDTLSTVAAHRQTEPRKLSLLVRGDLDWIVMKALEKDRTRRYETASGLGMDIEHYLNHEPVTAGPPGAMYRFRKFVRRNKAGVMAAALIFAALLVGLAGTGLGFRQALIANTDLGTALERVQQEQAAAKRSAARMEMVHEFFLDRMLGANDPDISGGEDLRVRKVLDDAVAELEHVSDPDLEAVLRQEIGAVYMSLGLWLDAGPQLDRALALREKDATTSKSDLADTLLLEARSAQGLDDSARAESLARRARALRVEVHGVDSDETAEVDYYLAGALYRQDKIQAAGEVNQASLLAQSKLHGPGAETPLMARTMVMYAAEYLAKQERHEDAATMLHDAVAILRRNTGVDSQLAWALNALSKANAELGRFDESDQCLAEAIEIRKRLYPQGHLAIAQSLIAMGINRMRRHQAADGEQPVRDAVAMYIDVLGPSHEFVAKAKVALGAILASQGKWQEAVETYADATAMYARLFPGDDARTANAKSQWGGCLIEVNRYAEAEPLLLDAYGMLERTNGNLAAQRVTVDRLVKLYLALDRPDAVKEWTAKADALAPPSK